MAFPRTRGTISWPDLQTPGLWDAIARGHTCCTSTNTVRRLLESPTRRGLDDYSMYYIQCYIYVFMYNMHMYSLYMPVNAGQVLYDARYPLSPHRCWYYCWTCWVCVTVSSRIPPSRVWPRVSAREVAFFTFAQTGTTDDHPAVTVVTTWS